MKLGRYSLGIGDRFGRQGVAQLRALQRAEAQGVAITPVWNKSFREHQIIGTQPADTRRAADAAVRAAGWRRPYFVDADHISLRTVDAFAASCDFFTLDVAESIGQPPPAADLAAFVKTQRRWVGSLSIPGLDAPLEVSESVLERAGATYLVAVREAARIYRRIAELKGAAPFVTEVSMDECETPQTPSDLLLILTALAQDGVPVETLAPKFSGRFNKGVDYAGDPARFAREFEMDLAVLQFARRELGLPESLKFSVHSGSDKFSLYPPIRKALKRFDAGLHLKTAGTTWLEEVIGLAASGGEGGGLVADIYAQALGRYDELCKPYATVIDIDRARLPDPAELRRWSPERLAAAIRHDERDPHYNPHLRQLLHVAYKVAAELGARYQEALAKFEPLITESVAGNLWSRHILPLFVEA